MQTWALPLCLFFCAVRAVLLACQRPPGDSWMDGLLLGFALMATLCLLSRWLPAQNWISIAVLTTLLSGAFEWTFAEGDFILPPWALPLVWTVTLLNARGTGQWMLQRWRTVWGYGFWLIGITGALTAMGITAISILTGQAEAEDSLWMSLAMRFVVACVILTVNATLFIRKNPAARPLERGHLTLWLAINLLAIAAAAIQGLWWLSAAGIIVNIIVLALSRKGK